MGGSSYKLIVTGFLSVTLNWLFNYNGETVVAIPGATKEIHIKENTGTMSFRLSDEDMVKLDKVSAIFK